MDPATLAPFLDDLRAAQHAVSFGVTASRAASADSHWQLWSDYCAPLAVDPLLQDLSDPIPLLQVFLHRYRTGLIAPRGKPVRARTAEDALRSVGQTFLAMGALDPRLTSKGAMDFRLARQLRFYKKEDPPPDRVKPVPVQVLRWIAYAASTTPSAGNAAIADMIILAFFFLLRPGEYTATSSDNTPFRIADLRLSVGGRYLDAFTSSAVDLHAADFLSLTFTTQKNSVRGEVVALGRSGDPSLYTVRMASRHILHLRAHGAVPDTPLSVYFHTQWCRVSPADITSTLRTAVLAVGPAHLGFTPADVSARCLRAAGAMALLCANVDTDVIQLLGRWRSDEMLRYLHLQAEPVMRNFSRLMLAGGHFALHPNADVPLATP